MILDIIYINIHFAWAKHGEKSRSVASSWTWSGAAGLDQSDPMRQSWLWPPRMAILVVLGGELPTARGCGL